MAHGETYEEFVAKFDKELPKTTDDCYTPPAVYEAVKDWAVNRFNLQGREIVRPFWPGGDYQACNYPKGCVVIDNPPFSIAASIYAYYRDKGIPYVLFCNGTTLPKAGGRYDGLTLIQCRATIVYANGATVNTNFVTNMCPDVGLIQAGSLTKALIAAQTKSKPEPAPRRVFPREVIRAAGSTILHDLEIPRDEVAMVTRLKAPSGKDYDIFGGGLLISDRAAAAANRAAAAANRAEAADRAIYYTLTPDGEAALERLNKIAEDKDNGKGS